MKIDLASIVVSVTPVVDITSAFADLDQMTDVFAITNAVESQTGMVVSLICIDKDKIAPTFDVLLFSSSPTITSVKNAALNISDTEMATKFLGRLSVSSWVTNSANSDATVTASSCGLMVQSENGSKTIYGILQARAAAGSSYVSASALTLKFGIAID